MSHSSTDECKELRKLYKEPTSIRKFIYDLILWGFVQVFDCFFREIRSRGGFKVPKDEPVIFVAAPHANQFVDPIILMSQVKSSCGRRVSCLIAEKSHRRKFIGLISRSQLAIPVKRAQDNLTTKKGTIQLDKKNPLKIVGTNTNFLKDCEVKGLIALPKSLGISEISEILSDTELILRKPIKYVSGKEDIAKKMMHEGTTFKAAPKIDQSEVYSQVFEHLARGHCIGLFSEGGSHDRPDLLPLKAGVAIMALGAVEATPGLKVKIVPVGMNYFHAHKFRSRAVVEFGHPIEISQDLVDKYSNPKTSKEAVKELLDTITKGVKAATVTCPDFETLSVVQAARRLYSNNLSAKLTSPMIVEMNRRLINGFLKYHEHPKIQSIKNKVMKYNEMLRSMNIPDHLVSNSQEKSKLACLFELAIKGFEVTLLTLLALPGVVLFAPVFVATKKISEKKRIEALAGSTVKIKGNDVLATWKILVSMGFSPILYTIYSILGSYIVKRYYPNVSSIFAFLVFYILSACITYCALIFGDKGLDIAKSLRSNWLMLINQGGFNNLKNYREELSIEITEVINEFGPQMYSDFDLFEVEKKLESKRLLKLEKKKKKYLLDEQLSLEEQLEDVKTQELRQRKFLRKKNRNQENDKMRMLEDTLIIADIGTSTTSSEFETESEGEEKNENEVNEEESILLTKLVRDKIREKRNI